MSDFQMYSILNLMNSAVQKVTKSFSFIDITADKVSLADTSLLCRRVTG